MYDKKDFINILAFCTYLYVQKNMKNTYKYVLHNKKESIRFVKQIFKQVRMKNLKLLFRLLLLLLLISCEKEENLTRTEQVLQQITSQKLTLKQLENKNPKAFNKITSINQLKETKIQSKEVYSPVYDFYIDTSSILNIQVNNYNSYTFKIFRINDDSTVENLILSETPNGNYKTGIIKYTLTEDEKNKISNHQYIDLKSKMSYTQIDFNSLNDLNLHSRIECRDEERTVWVTCSEGVHNSSNIGTWNQCTADVPPTMYIAVSTVCESTGGNGGNTGTGNIDTSGSGGSNTGVDNQNTDTNPTDTNNNNNNTPINEFEDVITQPLLTEKTPIQLFISNLSSEQLSWWNNADSEIKNQIISYLNENTSNNTINNEALLFVNELINLTKSEITTDNQTFNFVLQAKIQNKMQSELDDIFLQSVNQYLAIDTSAIDPVVMSQLKTYFTLKCAVLRYNHPDWSDLKIYWEASKDIVHITLDVFGMVPIVGEVADLTNGVLYLIEGDGVNATLSFAATVPIAGWTATGSKYAVKIIEASGNVAYTINNRVRLTWKVLSNGIIDFGYSNQLRKVLGLTDSAFQAHHIIPWAFRNNDAVQKAAKSGSAFHMNEELNGIPIHTNFHFGSHPNYNNQIQQYLNSIPSNATPDQAYNAINTLINNIKTAIQNNPTTHINQLTF